MTEDEIYQSHKNRDQQLLQKLKQFENSDERFNYWAGGLSLTTGTKFLTENGYHWLMDIIASWQPMLKLKHSDEFQVWTLKIDQNTKSGTIIATDGETKIGGQDVRYWNSFIESITLIIEKNVVYLPSEYEGLDFP